MDRLKRLGSPQFLRGLHGWLTIVWVVLIPVSLVTSLKTSVLWVVLISCYANVAGHASAWQASRVETLMPDGGPAVRSVDAD